MRAVTLGVVLLLPAGAAVAAQTCRQSVGDAKADEYARACTKVSPATHPPCNAQNPCDQILAEVYRGCHELKAAERPAFCGPEPVQPRAVPEVVPKE